MTDPPQGAPLQMLLEIVGGGSLVLDLSDVQDAVRMLARLPSDRFRLVGSPDCLGRGIASEQRAAAGFAMDIPAHASWHGAETRLSLPQRHDARRE